MYKYNYRIYYTGPEKFHKDGLAQLKAMKAEAERWGFTFVNDLTYLENGYKDYEHIDRTFLDDVDIVIGNVNGFRGSEPDATVCFDLGVGFAKGKKLYTFLTDRRDLIHRAPQYFRFAGERVLDENGHGPGEAYTLGNLMYMIPSKLVEGGFSKALEVLRYDLEDDAKNRGQRVTPKQDGRAVCTWAVEEGKYRAYLAGFECFMLDAREVGDKMKETCLQYNFEGIFPPDDAPGCNPPSAEDFKDVFARSAYFFDRDQQHIRNSNMVLANFNPYHGAEPDSGTVFEAGMSFGLGYPCYYFMSDSRPLIERIDCRKDADGVYRDVEGFLVEDFGFPLTSRLSANMTGIFHEYPDAPKYAAMDLGIYSEEK